MNNFTKKNFLKIVVGVVGAGLLCILPSKVHAESMLAQVGRNLVYGLFTHPIQAEKQCQEKVVKMNKNKSIMARIHSHHITMGYMAHHTEKIEQMKNSMSNAKNKM